LTALNHIVDPWISGEFDIASLLRGSPAVLNREQFVDQVDRELRRTRKCIGSRFAILLLKLEGYASAVETYGRRPADFFAGAVADKLGSRLAARDSIAILGPGTIGILLEASILSSSVQSFATDIQAELALIPAEETFSIDTTASIAIAKVSADYTTPDDILRDAGVAMRTSEKDGPGRIVVFYYGMDELRTDSPIATEIVLEQARS
jgi:GGDEF domain-containing protein